MSGLSLFNIERELLELIDAREECLELQGMRDPQFAAEELAAIDGLIRDYVKREVQKVDKCAAAIMEYQARAEIHIKEAERLSAKAVQESETAKRIKGMVLQVLQETDQKKIVGKLFTLSRQGNGGLKPLNIVRPELLPKNRMEVILRMPSWLWSQLKISAPKVMEKDIFCEVTEMEHRPNAKYIRESLEAGEAVPGCRLEPLGEHLRIR